MIKRLKRQQPQTSTQVGDKQQFKLTEIRDIDNLDLYVDARGDPSDISRTGNAVLRPVNKNEQSRQCFDFRLRYFLGQQYFW